MIKLKDILNEAKWESEESSAKHIIHNAITRYMSDTSKKIMDELLPKILNVPNAIKQINQNRKQLANILTKNGFKGEYLPNSRKMDPNDLNIYKNAAETVYNSSATQTVINNTIAEIIDKLSSPQYLALKGLWTLKLESTLKEQISKAVRKIAHMDVYSITSTENPRYGYSTALNSIYFDSKRTLFNVSPLVDSIYNTINKLL
jgi:hypothetical protein